MGSFAAALTPVLVLILIGYGLKRSRFLPDAAWSGMERLTYFVLFPALLIRSLGSQTLMGSPWPEMLAVVVGTLLLALLVLLLWQRLRGSASAATFTSIFQGGIRFNTYIALAVAQAFYGAEGLAFAAIAAGFMIVLINLLCIAVFVASTAQHRLGAGPFLRELIGNPLIVACALGWLLSLSGIGVPWVFGDILEIIGRAALPFGLLAVGAALRLEAVPGHVKAIAVASLVQFVLKPATTALLVTATGLTGIAAGVLIIGFMTPTAPSAYILARQLGGDTETMASIITFQTLLGFAVMPVIGALLLARA